MTYSPVRLGATGVSRVLTNLSYGDLITNAYNLVGGIATARSLYVAGLSTFSGVTTTTASVYVGAGQTLFVYDAIVKNSLTVETALYTNLVVSGIATFNNPIVYQQYSPGTGIAYFDLSGSLVSTANTTTIALDDSNLLLTVNPATGAPNWTGSIEGGEY